MSDADELLPERVTEKALDYSGVMAGAPSAGGDALLEYLFEELPYVWLRAYKAASLHTANVYQIEADGFDYLFDFSTELVNRGELESSVALEDRVVAVQGRSHRPRERRKDGIMRSQPLGPIAFVEPVRPARYDKGHFVAHSIGSDQLHINIFPQSAVVNQGKSEVGKVYRAMERYCAANPGTYCFSRPIYIGLSAHPYAVEFGVLRADGTLWVNVFPNCASAAEMKEIERLLREKLAGAPGES